MREECGVFHRDQKNNVREGANEVDLIITWTSQGEDPCVSFALSSLTFSTEQCESIVWFMVGLGFILRAWISMNEMHRIHGLLTLVVCYIQDKSFTPEISEQFVAIVVNKFHSQPLKHLVETLSDCKKLEVREPMQYRYASYP